MEQFLKEFRANEDAWDKKTPVHLKSDFYSLENFKNGETFRTPDN